MWRLSQVAALLSVLAATEAEYHPHKREKPYTVSANTSSSSLDSLLPQSSTDLGSIHTSIPATLSSEPQPLSSEVSFSVAFSLLVESTTQTSQSQNLPFRGLTSPIPAQTSLAWTLSYGYSESWSAASTELISPLPPSSGKSKPISVEGLSVIGAQTSTLASDPGGVSSPNTAIEATNSQFNGQSSLIQSVSETTTPSVGSNPYSTQLSQPISVETPSVRTTISLSSSDLQRTVLPKLSSKARSSQNLIAASVYITPSSDTFLVSDSIGPVSTETESAQTSGLLYSSLNPGPLYPYGPKISVETSRGISGNPPTTPSYTPIESESLLPHPSERVSEQSLSPTSESVKSQTLATQAIITRSNQESSFSFSVASSTGFQSQTQASAATPSPQRQSNIPANSLFSSSFVYTRTDNPEISVAEETALSHIVGSSTLSTVSVIQGSEGATSGSEPTSLSAGISIQSSASDMESMISAMTSSGRNMESLKTTPPKAGVSVANSEPSNVEISGTQLQASRFGLYTALTAPGSASRQLVPSSGSSGMVYSSTTSGSIDSINTIPANPVKSVGSSLMVSSWSSGKTWSESWSESNSLAFSQIQQYTVSTSKGYTIIPTRTGHSKSISVNSEFLISETASISPSYQTVDNFNSPSNYPIDPQSDGVTSPTDPMDVRTSLTVSQSEGTVLPYLYSSLTYARPASTKSDTSPTPLLSASSLGAVGSILPTGSLSVSASFAPVLTTIPGQSTLYSVDTSLSAVPTFAQSAQPTPEENTPLAPDTSVPTQSMESQIPYIPYSAITTSLLVQPFPSELSFGQSTGQLGPDSSRWQDTFTGSPTESSDDSQSILMSPSTATTLTSMASGSDNGFTPISVSATVSSVPGSTPDVLTTIWLQSQDTYRMSNPVSFSTTSSTALEQSRVPSSDTVVAPVGTPQDSLQVSSIVSSPTSTLLSIESFGQPAPLSEPASSIAPVLTSFQIPPEPSPALVLTSFQISPQSSLPVVLTSFQVPGTESFAPVLTSLQLPLETSHSHVLASLKASPKTSAAPVLTTFFVSMESSYAPVLTSLQVLPETSVAPVLTSLQVASATSAAPVLTSFQIPLASTPVPSTNQVPDASSLAPVLTSFELTPETSIAPVLTSFQIPPETSAVPVLTTMQASPEPSFISLLTTFRVPPVESSFVPVVTSFNSPLDTSIAPVLTSFQLPPETSAVPALTNFPVSSPPKSSEVPIITSMFVMPSRQTSQFPVPQSVQQSQRLSSAINPPAGSFRSDTIRPQQTLDQSQSPLTTLSHTSEVPNTVETQPPALARSSPSRIPLLTSARGYAPSSLGVSTSSGRLLKSATPSNPETENGPLGGTIQRESSFSSVTPTGLFSPTVSTIPQPQPQPPTQSPTIGQITSTPFIESYPGSQTDFNSQSDTTTNWLPPNLVTASSMPTPTSTGTDFSLNSSPTIRTSSLLGLPGVIAPSGTPRTDKNDKLVQIGFQYGLNYPFVASHPLSAAQIFQYLPQGMAYGLGIDDSKVQMRELVPWQAPNHNYMMTLARVWIPGSLVDELEKLVQNRSSALYMQPDPTVKDLMDLIDDTVPVTGNYGGSASDTGGSGGDNDPGQGNNSGNGGQGAVGALGSLDQSSQVTMQQSKVSGQTAGIAIGTVGGAIVAGALLLLGGLMIRKRRRKRHPPMDIAIRNGRSESYHDDFSDIYEATHNRSSVQAILPTPVGPNGPQISQPIMTENSLGWQ